MAFPACDSARIALPRWYERLEPKPSFRFDYSWETWDEMERDEYLADQHWQVCRNHIMNTYRDWNPSCEPAPERFDIMITCKGLTREQIEETYRFTRHVGYPHPYAPGTNLKTGPYRLDEEQLDLVRREFPDRDENWERLQRARLNPLAQRRRKCAA